MNARSCRSVTIGLTAVVLLALTGAATASAQYESFNVSLYAQIDLNTFGAGLGNDCWGFVSPSGREYALMGLSNKVAFVEITDPGNPDWFASVAHTNNTWCDIKVYQDVAYAVTAASTGIQVIDLADIDNHNVPLVRTIGSPSQNHNIAINTDSGYLYTCISRNGNATTVIFDLSNPRNPVEVGTSGERQHDVQVVTYTSGPYAGREIMFGSGEGRGLDVIDVTDKSNTFLVSRTTYPNLDYAHQAWTEDLQHLYLNDELDGIPRVLVFDITDLNNPVNVAEFSNGTQAIDHNNYVLDGILYTANYHAGMRMFDLNASPTNPPQIGWFDTYPANNGDGFDGAWGVYPFFPSGTVIVSDLDRGLFILDVSGAFSGRLVFTLPNGLPEVIDPAGGDTIRVEVTGDRGVEPQPGTGKFWYDAGAGFVEGQMNEVTPNVYDAVFPATECGTEVSFYFSADSTEGDTFTDPSNAPASSYQTVSLLGRIVFFEDNFETNTGWTVENLGAGSGDWQRGVPINDPRWAYAPITDSDGSGSCFLTENENNPSYPDPWNTDVDDGAVRLTSPTLDMSALGVTISYDYYLRLTQAPQNTDHLIVEIDSNDGAGPWTEIARHSNDNGRDWTNHIITAADLKAAGVTLTSTMKMRFTANDANSQSIVESGLDAFIISAIDCGECDPCDMNCDTLINAEDIEPFIGLLFDGTDPCCGNRGDVGSSGDINRDGMINAEDIEGFINCLFP